MTRGRSTVVVVALCALAANAEAEEPIRHVVKTGDTCAALAQHYYGDSRLVDVLHRANPALGAIPPPHVLREGSVIIIPPRPSTTTGPDAKLTTVRNRVEVATPETKPGKPNDPLFRGNRVSTQDQSAADVTFRDESQVKLGERTLVIILGDVNRAATTTTTETQTTLVTGDLRAWMSGGRQSSVANLQTNAANVRVLSGESKVSDDAKKTTRLAVYAGSSTIEAQKRRVEVSRGFGSKAELGKPPTTPRLLPSAPTWTTFPVPVMVDDGKPLAIIGEYEVPRDRDRLSEWHVQVARDPNYHNVVADTKAPGSTRRFEVTPPGPGHYFARVSAIDDDHFEGPFGRSAGVLVVRGNVSTAFGKRRLELDPPDASCMQVGNVPLTWVKGPIDARPSQPIRLRCAPFETDPTTLLEF
jgi:phage tail protein X